MLNFIKFDFPTSVTNIIHTLLYGKTMVLMEGNINLDVYTLYHSLSQIKVSPWSTHRPIVYRISY